MRLTGPIDRPARRVKGAGIVLGQAIACLENEGRRFKRLGDHRGEKGEGQYEEREQRESKSFHDGRSIKKHALVCSGRLPVRTRKRADKAPMWRATQ